MISCVWLNLLHREVKSRQVERDAKTAAKGRDLCYQLPADEAVVPDGKACSVGFHAGSRTKANFRVFKAEV